VKWFDQYFQSIQKSQKSISTGSGLSQHPTIITIRYVG